jgi:exportin-7
VVQATIYHCVIGVRILNELVSEMNYKNRNRTLTQQRKIAVSFRDHSLFQVFEVSLSLLNQLATRSIPFDTLPANEAGQVEDTLFEQSLTLLASCLQFDFIGTNTDEASEELSTIQAPSTWKERLQNGATLRLLFNVYKGCATGKIPMIIDAAAPPVGSATAAQPMRDMRVSLPRAAQCLDCISLLASVRRTLFSELERKWFLNHLIRGISELLREQQGLTDDDCYHQFSRLLARIKNNFQLSELIRTEGYAEWLDAVASFTIDACLRASWSSNSIHFILSLWSKLVQSVPYVSASATNASTPEVLIDGYVPKVRGRISMPLLHSAEPNWRHFVVDTLRLCLYADCWGVRTGPPREPGILVSVGDFSTTR